MAYASQRKFLCLITQRTLVTRTQGDAGWLGKGGPNVNTWEILGTVATRELYEGRPDITHFKDSITRGGGQVINFQCELSSNGVEN